MTWQGSVPMAEAPPQEGHPGQDLQVLNLSLEEINVGDAGWLREQLQNKVEEFSLCLSPSAGD